MGLGFSIGVHRVDCSCSKTYHVLPTLHEFLIDDLASIVLASLDVNGFLDDGVGSATQGLAGTILDIKGIVISNQRDGDELRRE